MRKSTPEPEAKNQNIVLNKKTKEKHRSFPWFGSLVSVALLPPYTSCMLVPFFLLFFHLLSDERATSNVAEYFVYIVAEIVGDTIIVIIVPNEMGELNVANPQLEAVAQHTTDYTIKIQTETFYWSFLNNFCFCDGKFDN